MELGDTVSLINAIVIACATVALVVITLWYARLTRDILKATNKPQVILYLHSDRRDVSLCVENIGTGYASDITFKGSFLSFKQIRLDGLPLGELEPFKSGINYLGSGYKIETYIFPRGRVGDLPEKSYDIVVTYKDSTGAEEEEPFSFYFGNWADTSQFVFPQKDDASDRLNRIAGAIESMELRGTNSGFQNWANPIRLQPLVEALEKIAKALERNSQDK